MTRLSLPHPSRSSAAASAKADESSRTPSSLLWLMRQRAFLQGEIYKLDKEFERYLADKKNEREMLVAKLAALDEIFPLHAVTVNPDEVPPVAHRRPENRVPLSYGTMTRLILTCLREANGEPRSTHEIAQYILERADIEVSLEQLQKFRRKVQMRLKNLERNKKVHRLHPRKTTEIGMWISAF